MPDPRLEIEPLREAGHRVTQAEGANEAWVEGFDDDAALRPLAGDRDRASRGGDPPDLGGEEEGAVRVVAHMGDVDEAAPARVEDSRHLVGEDTLPSARLEGDRALVELMRPQVPEIQRIADLVAGNGHGSDFRSD